MKAGEINKQTQLAEVVQFDFHSFAEVYIEDLRRTLSEMSIDELEKLYNEVVEAVRSDATIHFIGNGGSASLNLEMYNNPEDFLGFIEKYGQSLYTPNTL